MSGSDIKILLMMLMYCVTIIAIMIVIYKIDLNSKKYDKKYDADDAE